MSSAALPFLLAGLAVFFGFALSVQMRIIAGIALKRAAKAKFTSLDEAPARHAVVEAVNGGASSEPGAYLEGEYPKALGHIRLARKGTAIFAVLLIVIAAGWRFLGSSG